MTHDVIVYQRILQQLCKVVRDKYSALIHLFAHNPFVPALLNIFPEDRNFNVSLYFIRLLHSVIPSDVLLFSVALVVLPLPRPHLFQFKERYSREPAPSYTLHSYL